MTLSFSLTRSTNKCVLFVLTFEIWIAKETHGTKRFLLICIQTYQW